MKFKKLFLGLTCLLPITVISAQNNPLWEDYFVDTALLEAVGPESDTGTPSSTASTDLQAHGLLLSVPTSVAEEISELAAALDNDPLKIFNYVRNTIDYEHYFGLKKGAKLTLLEGSGNDFDQCALLGELLTAAGHTDYTFRLSGQRLDYSVLKDWFGLAEEPFPSQSYLDAYGKTITQAYPNNTDLGVGDYVAKQATHLGEFLFARGSRRSYNGAAAAVWYPTFPQKASAVFDRLWLQLTYEGVAYDLDPSYKLYEKIEGLDDLLTAAGYSRTQLLADAGTGTTGAGYVTSLDDDNVESYLAAQTQAMLSYLEQHHPDL
ncbi:MAG: hypothetical protein EA353_00985, partial [Puniceicoccaceae bacterium]